MQEHNFDTFSRISATISQKEIKGVCQNDYHLQSNKNFYKPKIYIIFLASVVVVSQQQQQHMMTGRPDPFHVGYDQ